MYNNQSMFTSFWMVGAMQMCYLSHAIRFRSGFMSTESEELVK